MEQTERLVITPEEAAAILRAPPLEMHISPTTIRDGLKSKTFPWGDFIPKGGDGNKGNFYIYRVQLEQWIADRS